MARSIGNRDEVQAIRLLSSWLDEQGPAGNEDYLDTDLYSSDLEVAADYLLANAGN